METTVKLRIAIGSDLRTGNILDSEQIIFFKENDGSFSGPGLLKKRPREDTMYFEEEMINYRAYLAELKRLLEDERIYVVVYK